MKGQTSFPFNSSVREVERWQEEVDNVVGEDSGDKIVVVVGLEEGERKSALFVWKRLLTLTTNRQICCAGF
jgi:hypothetical protein